MTKQSEAEKAAEESTEGQYFTSSYDRDDWIEAFLKGAAWAAPKWVSVKERLPQNSQTVLVYIPFSDMFVGIWSESKNHFVPVCEWVNGRDYDIENIHIVGQYNVATHWQPLPAAPEVEK